MKNLEIFTLKNNLTMNIEGCKNIDNTTKTINCCSDVIDPNSISKPGLGHCK